MWNNKRGLTMYAPCLPVVRESNPAAVIQVERITGPVLLISSRLDTMWTSSWLRSSQWR